MPKDELSYGERLEAGFNLLNEEYERPLPTDQTLWKQDMTVIPMDLIA